MNENQTPARFSAVDIHGLRNRLGAQCSPDPSRVGYVIGPDAGGRLCHVASCRTLADAQQYAAKLNNPD